ncbi:MAG: MFS transporter [Anaerolineae bacterium]|nr:MFS transporter [Anaerolineae bacterium]
MEAKKTPLLTRPLLLFMGTMILANIAGHMHGSLLPLYLQELGADVGQVGLFFTLGAIAPLAFQILGGWISDSIGRLQAVAVGSLAGVLGYFVYVFAPSWEWLLMATVTGAMARSFVAPSFMAFIAEESTEATRGRVYGLSQSLFMIVGIVGPPIGGYLSQYLGFRAMFVAAGALYATATAIRVLMARNAQRGESEPREKPSLMNLRASLVAMGGLVLAGGIVTWIFISDGVRDVTFNMAFQLLPLYMQNLMGLSNVEISWLSSIHGLVTMLLLTPSGWLSDKKGERVGIVAGFFFLAVAIAVFLQSRVFAGFAVVWALFGVGEALIGPAYNALISKVVPMHLRGTAFGLFSTSIGLISLPAPYIGAVLWEQFAPQVPFYAPLVATLLMLPIMWIKFKLPGTAASLTEVPGNSTPKERGGQS